MMWHKRNSRDFAEGTRDLTLEEIGAYSLILDAIYDRDNELPDDPRILAKVLQNCDVRVARRLLTSLVKQNKLYCQGGRVRNRRCDQEIGKFEARLRRAAEDTSISSPTSSKKDQRNQHQNSQNLRRKKNLPSESSSSVVVEESTAVAARRFSTESRVVVEAEETTVINDAENNNVTVFASDLASDDHSVVIRHATLAKWECELPHIKNLRGQIRHLLRTFAHIRSAEARMRYVHQTLATLEQRSIERAEERQRKAAEPPKKRITREPKWYSLLPE